MEKLNIRIIIIIVLCGSSLSPHLVVDSCASQDINPSVNMFGFICSLLMCVLFVIVFVLGCALPSPVAGKSKREVIGDDVVSKKEQLLI